MKKLLLLLLLPFAPLFAQTRITPDCVVTFTFTTTGNTPNTGTCAGPNGAPNGNGISSWILVYYVSGFSGISIVLQSAPDNAGVPGSWGTFAGTVLTNTQYPGSSGTNPNTATTSAFTGFAGYYPWMRVNLTSITGTGKVTGALYGFYNSTLAKAGSGGGGGGGGPTIAGTANEITVTGAGCTTPSTATCTISLPSGGSLPGNWSTPGTFTAGSGSGTTGAFDMIGKTSGATSTVTVDDNNTATQVNLPDDATSGLYMTTSTTKNPAAGCAQFTGTGTETSSTGTACGGGGGGGGASRGTFASRGSCSSSGNTYYSIDQPIVSECNGSTWADWAYGENVTLPSAISFTTTLNSAVINTNGTAQINGVGGNNIYGEDLALPSTPYTLFLGFRCLMITSGGYCGIYVRDTAGTKVVIWAMQALGTNSINYQVAHFSNYTGLTGGTQDFSQATVNQGISTTYLEIHDNGTNLTFFICSDRFNCSQSLFSESRTANLTAPGFLGWFVTGNSNNPSQANMVVFDWTVTQP